MSDIAIQVENLSKRYRIGSRQGQASYGSLRETLANAATAPLRRLRHPTDGESQSKPEFIWALKDVYFEVKKGEVVGIIGRNGAGKTTLLKVLSRITRPTKGKVRLWGRVGSLLEVGTGFHPELTGRENIYLNGAVLGMKRTEIERKFDEIVDFTEIEQFLDTPVKRYSSGMYMRLAFAVAAHLEPEILLVDEVLAVGDAAFQKKCLGKMGEVANEGRTVLFVSHNMAAVTRLCNRSIWIENGMIRIDDETISVVNRYISSDLLEVGQWNRNNVEKKEKDVDLIHAYITQNGESALSVVKSDTPFQIIIGYVVNNRLKNCSIIVQIIDMHSLVIFTSWDTDSIESLLEWRNPGKYKSICKIPAHFLKPGKYYLTIAANIPNIKIIDFQDKVLSFNVSHIGYKFNRERQGVVHPVFDWYTMEENL